MNTSTYATHTATRPIMKRALLVATILYPLVWLAGLLIPIPDIGTDTSKSEIWNAVNGSASLGWQSFLVHGTAGICILLIAWQIAAGTRKAADAPSRRRWILASGAIAGGISLIQFAMEEGMVVGTLGAGAINAETWWQTIAVLDGLKMFALAAFILAIGIEGTSAQATNTPRWPGIVAVIATIALIISGIGYMFLIDPLMLTAAASLPLLLISVTISGFRAVRRHA